MLSGLERQWIFPSPDEARVEHLSEELGRSTPLARLLVNRGVCDAAQARVFLQGDLGDLHDPFLLEDMDKAVARLRRAISSGERILIQGHDDVDGITSVLVLKEVLQDLGAQVASSVPPRSAGIYGLSREILEKAAATGTTLAITVDSGIMNVEETRLARGLGIDCIVTDHHEPSPVLPEAVAILDPKRVDSRYPWRLLAGVGVAYKLAQAVAMDHRGLTAHQWFGCQEGLLELVALGTIADRVSLLGENRIFARLGLSRLAGTRRPGLRALLQSTGFLGRHRISSEDVSESIVPPLSGSLYEGDVNLACRLLQLPDTDQEHIQAIVERLYGASLDYREEARQVYSQVASEMVPEEVRRSRIIVLYDPEVDPAYLGNVASRLREETGRPVVLIGERDGRGVAEARGPAGFDLVACFREAQDLLFSYGGHKQAAGFSISLENIPVFQTRARAFAERTLKPEDVLPVLTIETVLPVESWNAETLGEIERLQPFGAGNPEPVFSSSGVALEGVAGGALTCRGRTDLTVVVARRDAREARPGELGGGRSSDVAYRLRRDRQNSVLVLLEDWRPSSQ